MKYSEFSKQFQLESQLRATRAKLATPATTKAPSNPLEDDTKKAKGGEACGRLPKGCKGPVIAVMELPPKKIL